MFKMTNEPQEIFYKRMLKFNEAASKLEEIAYTGNVGLHELSKFYQVANNTDLEKFEALLTANKMKEALALLQLVTKTELMGINVDDAIPSP